MKYLNLTKQLAALAVAATLFSSCDKVDATEPVGDKGQTIVKIVGAGDPAVKLWSVDFVPTAQTLIAVDVRRDIPNNAELNKPMTVVVQHDMAVVTAVDPTLIPLPESAYTSSAPKVGGAGGTYTLNFAPGEFSKQIIITIPDATVLSTSDTYGLGFTLTSITAGDGVVSKGTYSIVYKIGAKNKYDGVYEMKGKHNRSPYTFPYLQEMEMITSGAAEVRFYWPAWPAFGHPIGLGPDPVNDVSMYGSMEPAITFNPATNEVNGIRNTATSTANLFVAYPPDVPAPGRFIPGTKTMYVYWYYTTGAGQNFGNRGWSDTLTYLHAR